MKLVHALPLLVAAVAAAACSPAPIQAEHITTSYADETIAAHEPHPSVLVELPALTPVHAVAPRSECVVGTRISCMPRSRDPEDDSPDDGTHGGPYKYCVRGADGVGHYSTSSCNTPLVFAPGADAVAFTKVAADFAIGSASRTEWVSARTPWLALDRDGNGAIDSERELFAGFAALAALDVNADGVLDRRDPAFGELVLWSDANQDKASTPDEVRRLADSGITRIPLAAAAAAPQLGSYEGETVAVDGGRIVDVYLAADTSR